MRPGSRKRLPFACGALAASLLVACSLTVPLGPELPEHASFAPATRPGVALEVMPLRFGHVPAARCAPAGEATCLQSVEIVHAAYPVKHPRATFLIEAGLSSHAAEDLARFPLMSRLALAYHPEGNLGESLARMERAGWAHPGFVLVTHAHWDHTSGLVDLSHPRVVLGPGESEFVRGFPVDKTPTVMPGHFAGATLETFAWDGPAIENFPASHDVLGDGSVVLVPLSGHTPGSMGVLLSTVRGRRVLFVGDAAWSMDAIELPSHKLAPLSRLTDDATAPLSDTLWRLHRLHEHDPRLLIVPTHDGRQLDALRDLATTPVGR